VSGFAPEIGEDVERPFDLCITAALMATAAERTRGLLAALRRVEIGESPNRCPERSAARFDFDSRHRSAASSGRRSEIGIDTQRDESSMRAARADSRRRNAPNRSRGLQAGTAARIAVSFVSEASPRRQRAQRRSESSGGCRHRPLWDPQTDCGALPRRTTHLVEGSQGRCF